MIIFAILFDISGQHIHNHLIREERIAPFKRKPSLSTTQSTSRNSSIHDSYVQNQIYIPFENLSVGEDYKCLIPNISMNGSVQHGFRNYRIVVTSTSSYFPIFINWLYQYYRFCPNTSFLYFVCFDKYVEAKLQDFNLLCNYTHYLPVVGSHQRLWLIRGLVVRKLISAGYDVLLADSDAVWIRNPFSVLAQFPQSDIIASRASYPEDIFERLGATICMGFVYFQSNPGVIWLWSNINDEMMKHRQPDDQRIVNHALMKLGIQFPRKLNYQTNKVHDTGIIKTKFYVFNVTLLSHSLFRRVCDVNFKEATRNSIVAHCSISGKDLAMKQLAAKNFDLWFLKPKWESIYVKNMTLADALQAIARPY